MNAAVESDFTNFIIVPIEDTKIVPNEMKNDA